MPDESLLFFLQQREEVERDIVTLFGAVRPSEDEIGWPSKQRADDRRRFAVEAFRWSDDPFETSPLDRSCDLEEPRDMRPEILGRIRAEHGNKIAHCLVERRQYPVALALREAYDLRRQAIGNPRVEANRPASEIIEKMGVPRSDRVTGEQLGGYR
ncbi:hypothetical protein N2601_08965 [Rhizobium sp. CB3060]|uniref:hypothetical protein n=1 Tax=Rhizobium sp. CB3060 TaxID=3138255 RepID=UPI0021A5986E|nr:hypothetical protein [Rhizobium tropici]UWU23055.1 hypothetical protein N2601_08965 [Rhizobium tropici]